MATRSDRRPWSPRRRIGLTGTIVPLCLFACGEFEVRIEPRVWFAPLPEGEAISGSVTLQVHTSQAPLLRGVELSLDGKRFATLTEPPFALDVDTRAWGDGRHEVGATAVFGSGLATTSLAVSVDNEPPDLAIRAPAGDLEVDVSAGVILFSVTARDPSGDVAVRLYAQETLLATLTEEPFAYAFDAADFDAADTPVTELSLRAEADSPLRHTASRTVRARVSRRLLWQVELDGTPVGRPVATQGRVYIATSDGRIHCYDGPRGERLWQADAGNELVAGVADCSVRNGVSVSVCAGDTTGTIHRFDGITGVLASKHDLGSLPGVVVAAVPDATSRQTNGMSLPAAGSLLVSFYDGRVYAFVPTDGATGFGNRLVLKLSRDAHTLSRAVSTADGCVAATYEDGTVAVCCHYNNCQPENVKTWSLGQPGFFTAPSASVALSGVYVGGRDGGLYEWSRIASGGDATLLAQLDSAIATPPLVHAAVGGSAESVIVTTTDGRVARIGVDGQLLWRSSATGVRWSEPVADAHSVYVAGTPNQVQAYSIDAGGIENAADAAQEVAASWRLGLRGQIVQGPALDDGVIYVAATDPSDATSGWLYAIHAQ